LFKKQVIIHNNYFRKLKKLEKKGPKYIFIWPESILLFSL
jgi:hypothetical protein